MKSSKFTSRTSWRAKLQKSKPPVIEAAPPEWAERFGGDKMLIASPLLVDAKIRTIPPGQVATMPQLRQWLADDHDADFACPLTTGIFARIAAEAAEEARAEGETDLTPWWRVVKEDGTLNPKFPGGLVQQAQLLTAEGVAVVPKGRTNLQVRDLASAKV